MDYKSFRQKLMAQLDTTPFDGCILFAFILCKSLLPNYFVFQKMHRWGDYRRAQKTLFYIEQRLINTQFVENDINNEIEALEALIPNEEIFRSVFVWQAIYAIDALSHLLKYALTKDLKYIINVSDTSINSVDHYISDATLPIVTVFSREQAQTINRWVDEAPLVIAQLHAQQNLLSALQTIEITSSVVAQLSNEYKDIGIAPLTRGLFVADSNEFMS